jgi:hypothetical protein
MKNLLLVLPLLALTSCGTLIHGSHEKVSVVSEPPGADVKLSTGEHGVAPAKFVKSRKGESFTITVSKPGYASQTVKVESKGSSLSPNPVSVHLVPIPKTKATKPATPSGASEKPRPKPKATASPNPKPEATPKVESTPPPQPESTPPPINESTPEPTATPYVAPSIEASPTP